MSKPSFYNDLSIPIIAAPLFLISGPKLVIECCKNGIVRTFPALNHRTTEGFEQWVIQIKEELSNFEKKQERKLHRLVLILLFTIQIHEFVRI